MLVIHKRSTKKWLNDFKKDSVVHIHMAANQKREKEWQKRNKNSALMNYSPTKWILNVYVNKFYKNPVCINFLWTNSSQNFCNWQSNLGQFKWFISVIFRRRFAYFIPLMLCFTFKLQYVIFNVNWFLSNKSRKNTPSLCVQDILTMLIGSYIPSTSEFTIMSHSNTINPPYQSSLEKDI